MIIIVGLGNPGEKFKNTRHNAGFMAVDFFTKKNDFPEFTLSKKYHAFISEKTTEINEVYPDFDDRQKKSIKVALVKPQTFMNESGVVVEKLVSNFKFQISNLIVIHDDIDLPLGKIKLSKDSGSGGHKGVDSIMQHLLTKDFIRVRIGICPQKKPIKVEAFVIKKFTKEEQTILNLAIEKVANTLDFLLKYGLEKTMNEYNR